MRLTHPASIMKQYNNLNDQTCNIASMRNLLTIFIKSLLICITIYVLGCTNNFEVNFRLNGNEFQSFESTEADAPSFNDSIHVFTVRIGDTVYIQDITTPAGKVKKRSWDLNGDGEWDKSVQDNPFFNVTFPETGLYKIVLCVNGRKDACATRWINVLEAFNDIEQVIPDTVNTDTVESPDLTIKNPQPHRPDVMPTPVVIPPNPTPDKPVAPPPPVNILRMAEHVTWWVEKGNTPNTSSLVFQQILGPDDYDYRVGSVGYVRSASLEDGKIYEEGLGIAPVKVSYIYADFKINELPPTPVFRAALGFIKSTSTKSSARFEIIKFYKDGSKEEIAGHLKKEYTKKIMPVEVNLESPNKRITKIRIKVDGRDRKNRLVLINPRIESKYE